MNTREKQNRSGFIMAIIPLMMFFSFSVAWSQPKGKFIYSASYDFNKNKIPKQTNYTALVVMPYQTANQICLKVRGVTKSGQMHNLPSVSGRYVFTQSRSGFSVYAWDEQCLIVNNRQNVIQLYRDITTGKYDEFIYYWK